jgi:uncharacterized protein YbbC (DUF1343 family)
LQIGLDQLLPGSPLARFLAAHRVGVLAHPASVDRDLVHVKEKLARAGIRPVIYFGPEHGFGGEAQDMIGVADARDPDGVPIRSLYGESFSDLSPRDEDLAGIDVMLVDLADVGSRYYTFVWTAVLVLRACAKKRIKVVVLDRPNPIDGVTIESGVVHKGFASFVGLEPVPIRHALTVGEIVAWCAANDGIADEALAVVACEGVERAAHAPTWDRPFVMTSPNMPTYETALVYPGGCLLEGTNLSEGRGTTRPFEIVGAPWVDGARLAKALGELEFPGFRARAITFLPTFQKHAKQVCGGVQIHVTDPRAFRPVATYAAMIALAHHHHPDAFRFRTERYEFVDTIPALDLLCGGAETRTRIAAGDRARDVAEDLARASDASSRVHAEARAAHARFAKASARL